MLYGPAGMKKKEHNGTWKISVKICYTNENIYLELLDRSSTRDQQP